MFNLLDELIHDWPDDEPRDVSNDERDEALREMEADARVTEERESDDR